MKTTNQNFKTEKNARSNRPLVLFTLFNYRGTAENLTFARNNENVVFDGVTYTKAGIDFQPIGENLQGEIDLVDISVLNVSRLIQSYLEQYDLSDKKIRIRFVWANKLSDPQAFLDYTFYVDSYHSTDTDAHFVCTTKLDLQERSLPGEIVMRNHCTHKIFKDPNTCGYTGPETECNRTKQRCKELGNFSRFGGCPSMPSGRYVI